MRYEFDHRTGSMQPKKDDNIYFAQSQGGGLIVDDKKNNIRYIIERDDRITKLFGGFDGDSLNFYDMRDARMIADRVVRLLGRNHKYSDFHYFLKGYHMSENFVQSCSSFLDESVWADIHKRSNGQGTVKKEDYGKVIGTLEDGTKLVIPYDYVDKGELVKFDDGNIYSFDEYSDGDIYIAVVNHNYDDTYYKYDEDTDEGVNMVECFKCDDSLRTENNFGALKALMLQDEFDDEDFEYLDVNVQTNCFEFTFFDNKFKIYTDRDSAVEDAIEMEKDLLESERFTKDLVEHFRNVLGDGFLDESEMKDALKESQEFYYNDLSEDDAIDELIRYNIIKDSEEYFELDEDGEIDHSQPKFDYQDYCDAYVEKWIDSIDDIIDEYLMNYGYDGIEDYIDIKELAKLIVDSDGPENTIASYDSVEREEKIGDITYYIYRTN